MRNDSGPVGTSIPKRSQTSSGFTDRASMLPLLRMPLPPNPTPAAFDPASVVNLFLGSSPLGWIISLIGVIIFTVYTAYDVQRISYGDYAASLGSVEKASVLGAIHAGDGVHLPPPREVRRVQPAG